MSILTRRTRQMRTMMALMATVMGSERLRISCNQAQFSVLKTAKKLPEQMSDLHIGLNLLSGLYIGLVAFSL